ncbi:SAM-dependent methyltransferase, partial [archaeon]
MPKELAKFDPKRHMTFKDYFNKALYGPTGYYTTGKVDIGVQNSTAHFSTVPVAISPHFGRATAHQLFNMWKGMRKGGSLKENEKFHVVEFGGGTGQWAYDILSYSRQKSRTNKNWKEFYDSLKYTIKDISPELSKKQNKLMEGFKKKFVSEVGDAREKLFKPNSVKGVFISNEVPDAFSPHKVVVDENGKITVAVVRVSTKGSLGALRELGLVDKKTADKALAQAAMGKEYDLPISVFDDIIGRAGKAKLQGAEWEAVLDKIRFKEEPVGVSDVPEVQEFLAEHPKTAAMLREAAKREGGKVFYLNTDSSRFIKNAGEALDKGYVLTVDYGMRNFLTQSPRGSSFRTYGDDYKENKTDQYALFSDRDMTTDPAFSV